MSVSSFYKQLSNSQVAEEYMILEVLPATTAIKEKIVGGITTYKKEFKVKAKAKPDILKVRLTKSDLGQQLTFGYQRAGDDTKDIPTDQIATPVATFTFSKDFTLSMTTTTEFNMTRSLIYLPLNTNFPGIDAQKLSGVFGQWLLIGQFFEHIKILSAMGDYTPELVKMLMLYVSYQDVKVAKLEESGGWVKDEEISLTDVALVFKDNMARLRTELPKPKMAKFYNADLVLAPAPVEPTPAIALATTEIVEIPDQVDQVVEVITPEQTLEIPNEDQAIETQTEEEKTSEKKVIEVPSEEVTEEPTAE